METKDIIDFADHMIANTYSRFPIVLMRGKGCKVWDYDRKMYLDFVAGIAVCNLGHSHKGVAKAIRRQASKLVHVCNLYYTLPQVELARWLTLKSFADKVFFCNSGAEANEAAIKIARKYFKDKGQANKFRIIAMKNSFHGRTMATLSATGQDKVKKGFDPLLDGFDFVPFNDIEALKAAITPETCAIITEPIQGEGGIKIPDKNYLKNLRELCNQNSILLIYDEIQTGMGRTGKLFAYEHYHVHPDIMTLAKGIANGLPMGAMLCTNEVAQAFVPGAHASTFGGTPLVASAALAVAEAFENSGVLDHCAEVSAYFKDKLCDLQKKYPFVKDVRGIGLLLGMELDREGAPFVKRCLEKGFLINCVQGNVLRFIPPLIVSNKEIDRLIKCLDDVFKNDL